MAAPRLKQSFHRHLRVSTMVQIIVIGLLLYLIFAGLSGITNSLRAIRLADPLLLSLAAVCISLSYLCAAVTYRLLATRKLSLYELLLVQISGGLVNRLLPAGLGGLGINAYYLKRHGHNLTAATVIVSLNNLLGFVGNTLLLVLVLMIWKSSIVLATPVINGRFYIGIAVLSLAAAALIIGLRHYKRSLGLRRIFLQFKSYLRQLAEHPLRALTALVSSSALTALHASGLFLVLLALPVSASWPVALLAISGGAIASALIPTPGGLGGAEAGIMSVLVAGGVSLPLATSAAIIYRGLTYWLPLLPGYVALRVVERRYL